MDYKGQVAVMENMDHKGHRVILENVEYKDQREILENVASKETKELLVPVAPLDQMERMAHQVIWATQDFLEFQDHRDLLDSQEHLEDHVPPQVELELLLDQINLTKVGHARNLIAQTSGTCTFDLLHLIFYKIFE